MSSGSAITQLDQSVPGTTNAVALPLTTVGSHAQIAAGGLNTVQSLTAPAGAYKLLIQAFAQNVRYTLEGTAATTGKGFLLTAGNDPTLIPVVPGQVVKVISAVAGAALEYQWGR